MSARRQYNDCYTNHYVADVVAAAGQGAVANSAVFDTKDCFSPSINLNVVALAQNKSLTVKLQDSNEEAANFVDVANTANYAKKTDMEGADATIEANGGYNFFYAGQKRYIRVVVTSVEAAPGATVRIQFQKHNLASKPRNTGF